MNVSWLDQLLATPILYDNGVAVERRAGINFIGLSFADSASTDRTSIAVSSLSTSYGVYGVRVTPGASPQDVKLGFFSAAPQSKPTINWSSAETTAVKELFAALVAYGLIEGEET